MRKNDTELYVNSSKNIPDQQKQTQELEKRMEMMKEELSEEKKKAATQETEMNKLQEQKLHLEQSKEIILHALDCDQRNIERMYNQADQYVENLTNMVNEIRQTRSYRVGRVIRILTEVLKTKNVKTYGSYLKAVVKRLFGDRKDIDRFAISMDHADQVIVYSRQFADTLKNVRGGGIGSREMSAEFDAALCEMLLERIRKEKQNNHRVICVMAPIFNSENVRDGYYRRIKAIDDLMGEDTFRIYMSWFGADYESGALHIQNHDAHHIHLSYINNSERHNKILLKIAKEAGIAYHHSVGYSNEGITRCRHIKKIFDLHGALPEELVMYGNYTQSVIESKNERLAVEYGDALVAVTRSLKTHINRKYPEFDPRFVFLPILDDVVIDSRVENEKKDYIDGRPIVVYAGGLQKWQMIDKMQDAIASAGDLCAYRIYTPTPKAFDDMWGERQRPKNMLVDSRSPKELMEEYRKCHYGFLLREDIPVNNVACPTKLIEYLVHGIVPILYTDKVGDFVEDGMKYISLSDFIAGRLPDEQERSRIARENTKVLKQILNRYHSGKEELVRIFQGEGKHE